MGCNCMRYRRRRGGRRSYGRRRGRRRGGLRQRVGFRM